MYICASYGMKHICWNVSLSLVNSNNEPNVDGSFPFVARVEGARCLKPFGARRDIGNVVPRYWVYV